MKQSFTLTELYAHRGCYSKEMVSYCLRGKDSITIDEIINHTDMKLTEKVWFISNHSGLTPYEHGAIAYDCASLAVDMYETIHSPKSNGRLIGVTIAGQYLECNTDATLIVPSPVKQALDNDNYIDIAMSIASNCNQQYAFAIYAACSRDPYDRIYSAARSIELAGGVWIDGLIKYLMYVSKV